MQTITPNLSPAIASKTWTDEAFMALPDDGHHYEIINGELIDMGNSGALHGYVCSTLMILLGGYVRQQNLGAMLDSSTAFKMKNGNKRSLDIAFFAKKRLQGMTVLISGYLESAPDLVVKAFIKNATVMMAIRFIALVKEYRNITEILQEWDCRHRKNGWEQLG